MKHDRNGHGLQLQCNNTNNPKTEETEAAAKEIVEIGIRLCVKGGEDPIFTINDKHGHPKKQVGINEINANLMGEIVKRAVAGDPRAAALYFSLCFGKSERMG